MSEKIGSLEKGLVAGLVVIGGGLLVGNCLLDKKGDEAARVLEDHDKTGLPDGGDADRFDTGYEPAEGQGGSASTKSAAEGMDGNGAIAEWMQDPDWMAAQNELDAGLSYVKAHFEKLERELDSLGEGDLLPNWVRSAHCDQYSVTLRSIGAAPEVDAQSDEVPVDDRWKFEYGDPSFPELGGTAYYLNYYPPSDSELGADLHANLNPLNSNATTDGVPCDAGEEAVVFDVKTQSRDRSNKYRVAGDFCAPGTEEVVEKTSLPAVEQQARDLCNRATMLRGY